MFAKQLRVEGWGLRVGIGNLMGPRRGGAPDGKTQPKAGRKMARHRKPHAKAAKAAKERRTLPFLYRFGSFFQVVKF
jgi:hypothetical protein